MAVAFSARSWVRLSFCISDMREDVLLSNITSEGVHRCFKRTVCPSLCVIARLVELPSCVSRCLSWREKLGASEWSGCCPQLSSVCCLRRSQESVIFPVRFTRAFASPFFRFLFFLICDETSQKLFQVSFLRQSKSVPDFVSDAAPLFLLLFVARCHSKDPKKGDKSHFAP